MKVVIELAGTQRYYAHSQKKKGGGPFWDGQVCFVSKENGGVSIADGAKGKCIWEVVGWSSDRIARINFKAFFLKDAWCISFDFSYKLTYYFVYSFLLQSKFFIKFYFRMFTKKTNLHKKHGSFSIRYSSVIDLFHIILLSPLPQKKKVGTPILQLLLLFLCNLLFDNLGSLSSVWQWSFIFAFITRHHWSIG